MLLSLLLPPTLQLTKALLREGKQELRRAGQLSSQTQATLRRASRQVLASKARRQELEAAEQVRVPRPPPLSPWPESQLGAAQASPLLPAKGGRRAGRDGAADPEISDLPGEGRQGLVGAARQAG